MATDLMLRRYVSGLRDGVLITTRPALNVISARFGSRSVVRIGEDHLNFRSYKPELPAAMRRWYPQLDAFAPVARAHPDWRLRIFGDGMLRSKLKDRIASLGMTDHISLEGNTNRFEAQLRETSFYVLSSRYEGLPVAAYDCHTGPGDVITDGYDGLLASSTRTASARAGNASSPTSVHDEGLTPGVEPAGP